MEYVGEAGYQDIRTSGHQDIRKIENKQIFNLMLGYPDALSYHSPSQPDILIP